MRRKTYLKLPNRYTGYLGEDCYRQEGRRYIKRLEHRAVRHAAKLDIREEILDANPTAQTAHRPAVYTVR